MRSLGGFVLLAGLGVGLFVYFPAPVDRNTTLKQATRASAERAAANQAQVAPIARAPATVSSRVSSFSPGMSLAGPQRSRQVAAAPVSAAPAAKVETIANWQTSVAATESGALEPTDADGRYKLVVDIQQQLKRVGCYWGRVNGSWNANTREAMREFTTRANAALPIEKPDFLLLTLLKSHNGRTCGAPEATVAATPPAEVLPWKAANAKQQQASRLFTPVPTSVVTAEPLPGRMAIGGPRDFPPAQEPLVPAASPSQQPGVATAALEPGAEAPGFAAPPAVAPKPRPIKKASKSHRASPGTPRYNLMLSLGGVY